MKAAVLVLSALLAAQEGGRVAPLDRRIPPPDRERNAERWQAEWRNPRVLVTRAGVFVTLGDEALGDGAKPVEELGAALRALPRRAWPDGRIVALVVVPAVRDEPPPDALVNARKTLTALGVETIETPVGCGCR
jgi:hypothetical protein